MYKVILYDFFSLNKLEEKLFERKKDAEFFSRIFESSLETDEKNLYLTKIEEVTE